jgi:hypothetical protein
MLHDPHQKVDGTSDGWTVTPITDSELISSGAWNQQDKLSLKMRPKKQFAHDCPTGGGPSLYCVHQ